MLEREGSLATISYIGEAAEYAEKPNDTSDGGIDNRGGTENAGGIDDGDEGPDEMEEAHDSGTPVSGGVGIRLLDMKYAAKSPR